MRYLIIPLLFACVVIPSLAQISSSRMKDPVVITGAALSALSQYSPGEIVAFKFSSGTWTQIPVQIDECAMVDIVLPYGPVASAVGFPPDPSHPKILVYTDPLTHTGADTDTLIDSDDELVFMAKDVGNISDGSIPSGVLPGFCLELQLTDPLAGNAYVYLFLNNGSLIQSAGVNYVSITSNLQSTSLFPAHINGLNTENTTISANSYTWHFSSEWVSDELKILSGTGVDILDRYKNFFVNGDCSRHEDAFSGAENAFVAVKSGPVRIIRSYAGAVSGPFSQRTHLFYADRHDIATDLRVHAIASIYDVFDYSPAASGMQYSSNIQSSPVTINGSPNNLTAGDLAWERVSGTQGTLSIIHQRTTNMTASDAAFTSYFDDNSSSPASNCTGDGQAWGTSGIGIVFNDPNVCTDPMVQGCAGTSYLRNFQARRIIYADSANSASAQTILYKTNNDQPMSVSASLCLASGIKKAQARDFFVYPNPVTNGYLSIELSESASITIIDYSGKEVLRYDKKCGTHIIHLSGPGLFLLKVQLPSGAVSYSRILVE